MWLYLVCLGILLNSGFGSEQVSCQKESCSTDFGENINAWHTNGLEKEFIPESSVSPDTYHIEDDISYGEGEENFEEIGDIWNEIFEYISATEKLIYFFLCVALIRLWRKREKAHFASQLLSKKRKQDNFSDPARYENELIFPGNSIRPLSRMEYFFAIGGSRDSFCTHQVIWLRSKSPIDESVMESALVSLTKQYPFLQMCIKIKYFGFWFKRMENMKIDFTTTTNDVMTEFRNGLSFTPSNFTGPLWRVKLVKCPPMTGQPNERNFKAALIFSVAHSITDAFTNNVICRETIRFYNLLISGKSAFLTPAIFSPPLGNELGTYTIWELFSNIGRDILPILTQKSYVACICPKAIVKHQTMLDFGELTEQETMKLFAICKKENITINSFVNTAAAVAYVQTANKFSGAVLNKLDVSITQFVDLRRFVEKESDKLNGCYISIITTMSKIDLKKKTEIWQEAKIMQETIQSSLKDNSPIKHSSIFKYTCLAQLLLEGKRFLTSYEANAFHFSSSNMGDISRKLPPAAENDNVEIYDILRSVGGTHNFTPFILEFHTFRKILKFSIDFSTRSINKEPALFFFSRLMNIIRKLTREEILPPTYNLL